MEAPRPGEVEHSHVILGRVKGEMLKLRDMNPADVVVDLQTLHQRDAIDAGAARMEAALLYSPKLPQIQDIILSGFETAGDDPNALKGLLGLGTALHMDADLPGLFAAASQKLQTLQAQAAAAVAAIQPTPTTAEPARAGGTSFGAKAVGDLKSAIIRLYDRALPPAGNMFAEPGSAAAARVIPDADRTRAIEGLAGDNPAAKAVFDQMAKDNPGKLNDLVRKFLDAERRIQPIDDAVEVISRISYGDETMVQAVKRMLLDDPARIERWLIDLRDLALNVPIEYWPGFVKDRIPPGDPDTLEQRGREYLRTHPFNIAEVRKIIEEVSDAESEEVEPATTTTPANATAPHPLREEPEPTIESPSDEDDFDTEAWEAYAEDRARTFGYESYDDMAKRDPERVADILEQFMTYPGTLEYGRLLARRKVGGSPSAEALREASSGTPVLGETDQPYDITQDLERYEDRDGVIQHYQEVAAVESNPEHVKERALNILRQLGAPSEPAERRATAEVSDDQRVYIEGLIKNSGSLEEARRIIGNWPLHPSLEDEESRKTQERRRATYWAAFNKIEGVDRPLPTEFVPEPQIPEPEGDAEKKPDLVEALWEELRSVDTDRERSREIRRELARILPQQTPEVLEEFLREIAFGYINSILEYGRGEFLDFLHSDDVIARYDTLFSQEGILPSLREAYLHMKEFLHGEYRGVMMLASDDGFVGHPWEEEYKKLNDAFVTALREQAGTTHLYSRVNDINSQGNNSFEIFSSAVASHTSREALGKAYQRWNDINLEWIKAWKTAERTQQERMEELARKVGLMFVYNEDRVLLLIPIEPPSGGNGGQQPPEDEPRNPPEPRHQLAPFYMGVPGIESAFSERKELVYNPDFMPGIDVGRITEGPSTVRARRERMDEAIARSGRQKELEVEAAADLVEDVMEKVPGMTQAEADSLVHRTSEIAQRREQGGNQ